jgi:hypothetical protein
MDGHAGAMVISSNSFPINARACRHSCLHPSANITMWLHKFGGTVACGLLRSTWCIGCEISDPDLHRQAFIGDVFGLLSCTVAKDLTIASPQNERVIHHLLILFSIVVSGDLCHMDGPYVKHLAFPVIIAQERVGSEELFGS